jgi:hypothetical protein
MTASNAITETRNAARNNQHLVECPRCMGRGVIEAFGHYANGVCFQCKGEGKVRAPKITATEAPKVEDVIIRMEIGEFELEIHQGSRDAVVFDMNQFNEYRCLGRSLGTIMPYQDGPIFSVGIKASMSREVAMKVARFIIENWGFLPWE